MFTKLFLAGILIWAAHAHAYCVGKASYEDVGVLVAVALMACIIDDWLFSHRD